MSHLVYLDTETFGLDVDTHQIWEVAWAVNDDPIEAGILNHNPLGAYQESALQVNGYRERAGEWDRDMAMGTEMRLWTALRGATVVGANPMFDLIRLSQRWKHSIFESHEPWHYRSIDIESYAMPLLGLDRPQGMRVLSERLREYDETIPMPDHTAAGDVECLRACYKAAQGIYSTAEVVRWAN